MANQRHLISRFSPAIFVIVSALMMFLGLYPFNFRQANGVQWLSDQTGLYFDGAGIAYTKPLQEVSPTKAVTVELLLKERRDSKNWGPREIFSFFDGGGSPSLLVGQWDGRIFLYSRFEVNKEDKWYRLFRTKKRFSRGKPNFVTVTFDEKEKAIYVNGQLHNKQTVRLNDGARAEHSGRFLIGNSPSAKNGWFGEIQGLAVYHRVLMPDEIENHSRAVFQKGMGVLREAPGCAALYPFREGKGNTAASIVGSRRPFLIPAGLNAVGLSMLSLPHNDMRKDSYHQIDILNNILFFIPFGFLLSRIIQMKDNTGYPVTFLIVILAGGALSFAIEYLQLYLPSRSSGIIDIGSNIFGSSLGSLISVVFSKVHRGGLG